MDKSKIFSASQAIIEVARVIESSDMTLSKLCLFVSDKLLELSESLPPEKPGDDSEFSFVQVPKDSKPSQEGVVRFVKDGEQPEDLATEESIDGRS